MSNPILVTGASGVLGGAIVRTLVEAGVAVRQAVRNPQKAQPGIQSATLDYKQPATFDTALAGAAGVVLIAPSLDPGAPAQLAPFVATAKASGVSHIFFISAFGTNHSEESPLRIIEHIVIGSGIPYTILRPNFFMENFSTGFLSGSIRAQNGIFLAAGDSKTSFISTRDVAAVTLAAFQKPQPGAELDLTGPESLDHSQAAALIAEAAGRPITYHPLTEEQMAAGARAACLPEFAVQFLGMLYGVVRAGHTSAVTHEVERVTGRPPTTFREFATQNAVAWK